MCVCVRADSRVIGFGVEGFRVRAFGLRLDASTLNGKGIDFRKVCVCVFVRLIGYLIVFCLLCMASNHF